MRLTRGRVLRVLLAGVLGVASLVSLDIAVSVQAPSRSGLTSTIANQPGDVPGDQPAESPEPLGSPGIATVPEGPPPARVGLYRAPSLSRPLIDLDPGLATRGPRPTLTDLLRYQYGNPSVIFDPSATTDDWQLARPDANAVRGYADALSVLPGQAIGLHLTGNDRRARLDIFRMGLGDGRHVLTVPSVDVSFQVEARPAAGTGLVEEQWPRSYLLAIPDDWRSGVYLAKLTGSSGGQSYVPFIVRALTASPLTVVVPMTTWEAYNVYGGSDLYSYPNGPEPRAYAVSYDRPFASEYGAGLFFRLDFPLIAWLEDHGYAASYVADVDIARAPGIALDAKTLVFSGHSEYWTGSMRDAVDAAAGHGTNLAFFGANQAFWQIRLGPDTAGTPLRTVTCYKNALVDPMATVSPPDTTVRFEDPPVNRPPSKLMGLRYGGVIDGIQPLVVGPGLAAFDPSLGLTQGELLPGLIADEIDAADKSFGGVLLGATPVAVREHPGTVTAGAALWIGGGPTTTGLAGRRGTALAAGGASGQGRTAGTGGTAGTGTYRVFDAGTFDFAWGLDPRYSAALPGFPAAAYSRMTAEILAWLGARPTA